MRIAIFTPTFLPKCSGAEIFHHNLASQFVTMGHEPSVILPRSLHRRLQVEKWNLPYATIPFAANIWSYFKYSAPFALWISRFLLSSLQRKHAFDIWHAVVLSPAGICFANWQSRSRVPGLVRAVGDDVQNIEGAKIVPGMERLIRAWIPRAGCVVSLSHDMSRELLRLGVPAKKLELISNAVDTHRFGVRVDKTTLRKSLGIPHGALLFLCVARNHPQKDLSTLLEAFQLLAARVSSAAVHLAVVGRGVSELQSLVESMGIAAHVHLLEASPQASTGGPPKLPPDKLVDFYHAADAFVLSSLLEGFSSALLEAMASGLPIIATAAPGIVDQVENETDGLLVPCGDPEKLAGTMARIFHDRPLRERLGAGGARRAKDFSWENVALKYTRLYTRLIDEMACG